MVRTFCGSNPGSTCSNREKLRISSPAAINKINESVTCPTTSRPRSCMLLWPPVEPRPSSRSVWFTFVLERCRAGKMPKRIPVRTEIATIKRSTRASMVMGIPRGRALSASVVKYRVAAQLKPSPSKPPRKASSTLSVSSCRDQDAALRAQRRANGNLFSARQCA